MQQELEKSAFSTTVLGRVTSHLFHKTRSSQLTTALFPSADSSRTMSSTYSEYQNFGSLLNLSKAIITKLETSDWLDRILVLLGLLFFLSVVIYIIKKRTWDVGISWATWLMGKGGKMAASQAATAVMQPTPTFQPTDAIESTVMSSIAESSSSIANSVSSTIISSVSSTLDTLVEEATTIVKDEL